MNSDNFEVRADAPKFNADLRSSYIMNSTVEGIEETDLLLLVGVNPKTENPVLNARILAATKAGTSVALIGSQVDLGYEYIHLGNSTQTLAEIAEGRHPFCARLANARRPILLLGARTLERKDGDAILQACHTVQRQQNILDVGEGWNGFNILHHEAQRVGALDVGLSTSNQNRSDVPQKLVYLLGADNLRTSDIPQDAFVIYQGSHGDEGAYFADLILPGVSYTEKSATYVNTEGRVQLGRKVIQPPGMAKEDWTIIRALSEECGVILNYDTIEEVNYLFG